MGAQADVATETEDFSEYTKMLEVAVREGAFTRGESLDAFWFTFEKSPEVIGELERLQEALNYTLDEAGLAWRVVDLVWDARKLHCLVNIVSVHDVFTVYSR